MSNSMAAGARVAVAIGVVKWVLIGLAMVTAGVGILLTLVDPTADYTVVAGIAWAVGCVVWSLFVWVLFGWFEHTLSALVAIARNTGQQFPVSYDVPPAAYEQRRG
ncbi:hypothetical protein EV651_112281 [Kribbella sp. VKM Ac-2571]|uniref:hypothetical protein n=1 Tax=Kribbella sp. VKM Ac-2571 TaxID=2512222 RepID=UPI00105FCDC9|nr:hypothetical protein [Kribbella sp. VKM Ac-2571]TDO56893.1 hypothetical protein EV651_112281 [Kribbella sp. VKM Ac-2571]